MVELQHGPEPQELAQYRASHPQAGPKDFGTQAFTPTKQVVKACLHRDQGGLCVYCERQLQPTDGQVEHIKPKGGLYGCSHLTFIYQNYAHSCKNEKTCGQKKGHTPLPIEPWPGCNADWTLSTDGTIEPVLGLSKQRKHEVTHTCWILGLNNDAGLIDDRKRHLMNALQCAQMDPDELDLFLSEHPFRYITSTVF